ncbi:MAG: hypothetical protein IPL52_16200 [Flavobacteriales bacterium]|nr:hypothetical protein [Flavobacteriales bacterium]
MKHATAIVVLLLASCGTPEERMAERALRLGASRYHAGDFSSADSLFATAPDNERAVRNRGNTLFRTKAWSEAIAQLRQAALMDTSSAEQATLRYNLGRTHLAEAAFADTLMREHGRSLAGMRLDAADIATRVNQVVVQDSLQREMRRLDALVDSSLVEAVKGFKGTLRLAPADDSARHNLAIAQRALALRGGRGPNDASKGNDKDKDQQLSARAQLIMQHADSLVEEYKFRDALDILQRGLKEDPSLKAKKEYMDKLDTVNKAAQAQ